MEGSREEGAHLHPRGGRRRRGRSDPGPRQGRPWESSHQTQTLLSPHAAHPPTASHTHTHTVKGMGGQGAREPHRLPFILRTGSKTVGLGAVRGGGYETEEEERGSERGGNTHVMA